MPTELAVHPQPEKSRRQRREEPVDGVHHRPQHVRRLLCLHIDCSSVGGGCGQVEHTKVKAGGMTSSKIR